jgi:hypothetical protein
MNAKPDLADQSTLYCSFCRKSQHEVKKLIAGPATFICDECVALCVKIVADTPDRDPNTPPPKIDWPGEMPNERLLKILSAQGDIDREVRERLLRTVDILRGREVSWADIGAALGVSRQAAWERFS